MLIFKQNLAEKYQGPGPESGGNNANAKVETRGEVKSDMINSNDLSKAENRIKLYERAQTLITELEQRGDQDKADRIKRVLVMAQENDKDQLELPEKVADRLQKRMESVLRPPQVTSQEAKLSDQRSAQLAEDLEALGAAKDKEDAVKIAALPKFPGQSQS